MKANGKIEVTRYCRGLVRMRYKGARRRLFVVSPGKKIDGYRIYAEKHCVNVKLPAGHKLAYNLPEGKWLGCEGLVLITAINVNPALFGRE